MIKIKEQRDFREKNSTFDDKDLRIDLIDLFQKKVLLIDYKN